MHLKDGDLILGMHDLDHVLGDPNELGQHLQSESFKDDCGSDAFLKILDQSGELWMAGILPFKEKDDRTIRQALEAIGCKRIVIRLEQVMAGPADLSTETR